MMKLSKLYYHTSRYTIMNIGLTLSLASCYLSYHLYLNAYADRLKYNPNYNGAPGGEILIPILILFITLQIFLFKEDSIFIGEKRKY